MLQIVRDTFRLLTFRLTREEFLAFGWKHLILIAFADTFFSYIILVIKSLRRPEIFTTIKDGSNDQKSD